MQISQYMILYTSHGAKAGVAMGPRPAETYRGVRRNAAKVEMRHAKARMWKAAREALS